MQVYEFHFNPKRREDLTFDTFIYEPENLYEKKLGNLYIAGELTKALPKDSHFLANLAETIKREFYSSGLKKSSETSLKDSLQKANELLDGQARQGNVTWMGNLNFGILNIRESALNLTKVGSLKVLLVRQAEITDLSQSLEVQARDPLKTFGNIATGKLADKDKILLLTKEVYAVLAKNKSFFNQLVSAHNENEIKNVFKAEKDTLAETSGVCLLIVLADTNKPVETVTFHAKPAIFSFKTIIVAFLAKTRKKLKPPKINFPKIKPVQLPKIKLRLPNIKIPSFQDSAKKKLILVGLLILLLLAGFLIFKDEKAKALQESQQKITEVQEKITMAQNLLILKDKQKARALFQETLDALAPLAKAGMPLRNEARSLQKLIKENLDTNF